MEIDGQHIYEDAGATVDESPNPFKALRLRLCLFSDDRVFPIVDQMAVDLEVASSTISNWEQNKNHPHLDPLRMNQLCLYYCCELSDLAAATTKTQGSVDAAREKRNRRK